MKAWPALLVVAGCVASSDDTVLQIEAREARVVVVQDGDGPWQQVALTSDGTAAVEIGADRYGVGALCTDQGAGAGATFLFDTLPRSVVLTCPQGVATMPAPVHVRGSTAPGATVWIAGRSAQADATGAFDVAVSASGQHDVIALVPTTPPAIVARRALVLAGDTVVDLPAADAVELTALYPMLARTDAGVAFAATLHTATDRVPLPVERATVFVPPPSFLVPADRTTVAARGRGCAQQRSLAAAGEPFALPAPLVFAVDRSQVAWTADPAIAWDAALVEIDGGLGGTYSAYASASWRATTVASAIPIVDLAALPGWSRGLPSLVPEQPASLRLTISTGSPDGDLVECTAGAELARW